MADSVEEFVLLFILVRIFLMDDAVEEERLPVGVILLFGLNSRLKIVRLLVLWHFVPD